MTTWENGHWTFFTSKAPARTTRARRAPARVPQTRQERHRIADEGPEALAASKGGTKRTPSPREGGLYQRQRRGKNE